MDIDESAQIQTHWCPDPSKTCGSPQDRCGIHTCFSFLFTSASKSVYLHPCPLYFLVKFPASNTTVQFYFFWTAYCPTFGDHVLDPTWVAIPPLVGNTTNGAQMKVILLICLQLCYEYIHFYTYPAYIRL